MKIIADTNIWYEFEYRKELFEKVKNEPISPTYINIHELCKTKNLLDKEELVRNVIRKLFHFKANTIFEPPFIYIAKLHNKVEFDVRKEISVLLEFTSKIASDYPIDSNKLDELRTLLNNVENDFLDISEIFNQQVQKVKKSITNKKLHKSNDTTQLNGRFLNFLVETSTNKKNNLIGFDLDRIELLTKTMDCFFKKLEVSQMKFQLNDWYDLLILSYVQPGDKFWTKEKRWINLINEAGCENYLFKE